MYLLLNFPNCYILYNYSTYQTQDSDSDTMSVDSPVPFEPMDTHRQYCRGEINIKLKREQYVFCLESFNNFPF